MKILYSSNQIEITDEYFEIKGVQYPKDTVNLVYVKKHNEEIKNVILFGVIAIICLYTMYAYKWKILSGSVFGIASYFSYINIINILQDSVITTIVIHFKANSTSDIHSEAFTLQDFKEAKKIESLLLN